MEASFLGRATWMPLSSKFTHILEHIHEWNETFYFWMENKHIGRMCIVDTADKNANKWGAWDKILTYIDVYVPKHITKGIARSQRETQYFMSYRDAFSTQQIFMAPKLSETVRLWCHNQCLKTQNNVDLFASMCNERVFRIKMPSV